VTRLAFCSPLPPEPTGIADYAAEVLALLADGHDIDVFHDQPEVARDAVPAGCGVFPAAALRELHRSRPYDLAIHQLGNGPGHAFVYPLLTEAPGLLVLHDLVLHHSRAAMLLDSPAARAYAADPSRAALRDAARGGEAAYAAEAAYGYPAQARRLVAAHLNTTGDLLPYAYPLFQLPVAVSRLTAVHNAAMARAIEGEMPGTVVAQLAMPAQRMPVAAGEAAACRQALGIRDDELVVGCFGLLTREKRVETVARAVARAAADFPSLHLLLVGAVADRQRLEQTLRACGVYERTTVAGRAPMATLPVHIEAADVVVHLRYPTARETSAALLRVLAQGRPVVMSDVDNFAEVPDDAVLRADTSDEEGAVTRAILRLAASRALRDRLGRRAAAFIAEHHSPARARLSYERAIHTAVAAAVPRPAGLPLHWMSEAVDHPRSLNTRKP
jgi:glycosyltransferase involved in cell wall biosynthesis